MRLLHVLVGRPLVTDSNLQKLLNPWQTQPSRPSLFISDSLNSPLCQSVPLMALLPGTNFIRVTKQKIRLAVEAVEAPKSRL